MDTMRSTLSRVAVVPVVLLLAGGAARVAITPQHRPQPELDGDASSDIATRPPNAGTQAGFTERSYAPGTTAILHLRGSATALRIRLYHAGAGHDGPLDGAPVGPS